MISILTGTVAGLQVGKPQAFLHGGKEWVSGMAKAPAEGPVFLGKRGFDGDGQADLVNHGGEDKAVCVYCIGHYPYWEKVLGQAIGPAAFGENVTVTGMTEEEVCIGDILRLGQAVVQISQPRQPCYKLGYKYGRTDMPVLVQNTGYTGYYYRVVEEGLVAKGDGVSLLDQSPHGMSVAAANRIMYMEKGNKQEIERLLAVPELSASWRTTLTKRLSS
ncbi:MAG: hypothetical protein K0R57_3039 [Paenibacillaceae bacterium]|nr:hypothetical protein [Paenibacillaceae bacterium]